jgi:Zn-dependent alcohol dehydrogenase
MNAKAAILYEVKKPLVVEDVEVLEPGPHEVLVKWVSNGVCHSDLHVMTGDYPHPLPVVLGHEAAGVVQKIGAGVESVSAGDHVCSSYIPSCGKCWYCIGGQPTMCALRDKPRWFMLDGTSRFRNKNGQDLHHFLTVAGYATHAVLPETSVIPIRKDAPLDVVSLVSCGVLAGAGPVFNRAKVPPGASVAVWGCGGVGLNTIQMARLMGAGKIIAVDVMKQKLAWAEEFGATHVVDASKGDPVAQVHAISGMGGVDYAFEVVGTQKTIEQALLATHRGGTCVVVGVSPAGTRLSIDPGLFLQQRVLTGASFGGGHQRTDVPMLIDLYMSGKYKLDEMITRKLPLSELNHAFDMMLAGEVKRSVIVYP